MGTLPIQHDFSIALDNHAKDIEKLMRPTDQQPMHLNFL